MSVVDLGANLKHTTLRKAQRTGRIKVAAKIGG